MRKHNRSCSPGEFAIARTVNDESLKIKTKHAQGRRYNAACRVTPKFQ
nr:MAG TPA: hypothetical protein [Caudoviricetes sp.]